MTFRFPIVTAAALVLMWTGVAQAIVAPSPQETKGLDVVEKFGSQVDPNWTFTDHRGEQRRLGDFFDGKRPVLLTMNWFKCKTLCDTQLNLLANGLKNLEWTAGTDGFRMVTVSIDPEETHPLASGKRDSYLDLLDRGANVDWTFMVGNSSNINGLADDLGYRYNYDEKLDQYVHAPVVYVLTPDGRISHYLFGLRYESTDLKLSLMDASQGRLGSTFDKLLMNCFHYDPTAGGYAASAMDVMRFFAILTVLILLSALLVFWLVDRRHGRLVAEAAV
jgi:protein SCO1